MSGSPLFCQRSRGLETGASTGGPFATAKPRQQARRQGKITVDWPEHAFFQARKTGVVADARL
jgi:hypothetical protein